MNRLKRVPVVGWLIGGIAVLVCLVWWLWRRLAIAQARIRVDAQLKKARDMSSKAALVIMQGHRDRGREIAIESEKKKIYYEKKRETIRKKAGKLETLSQAVNEAFRGSP